MTENIIDLNKIFQVNLTYNFDLLKTVLEALMKNQEETNRKMMEFEEYIENHKDIKDNLLM